MIESLKEEWLVLAALAAWFTIEAFYGDRMGDWVERKIWKKWRSAFWVLGGMYLFVVGVMGAVAALGEGGSTTGAMVVWIVSILLGGFAVWAGRNYYKEGK